MAQKMGHQYYHDMKIDTRFPPNLLMLWPPFIKHHTLEHLFVARVTLIVKLKVFEFPSQN